MTPLLTLTLLGARVGMAAQAPALIEQDATWTAADSPWEVFETVTVAQGATLTIESGVTVLFDADTGITVQGALVASGDASQAVIFTRAGDDEGEGTWAGITFAGGSEDASFTEVHSWAGGSKLEGCELRYGARAVLINGASPFIHGSLFEHNSFEPEGSDSQGGAAIRIIAGSRSRIEGNSFEDNHVGGWGYGGAIEVLEAEPIIHGNSFVGNSSVYGGALCVQISQTPVVGNHFEGNLVEGEGGAVALYSAAGTFMDNTVTGNESVFDGGGVHVCVDCKPHAAPWVTDNVITDNLARAIGAGGFGAAWIRGLSWNDIHGNLRADEPADLLWSNEEQDAYPAWVHSPAMPHNWWGTTDPDAIEETIVDGADEDEYGVVDWQPAAEGPIATPTPRAVITTPMLRYDQAEHTMTSNLVLYNPGEARALELRLFVRVNEAQLVPYTADLGVPELTASGDAWSVSMPADSLIFATIAEPVRGTQDMPPTAAWVATLHDPATGVLIGDALETPVALSPGGAR